MQCSAQCTLEPKTTKSSHLPFGLKLVLIPKAVRMHWPVLPGRPGLVEVRPGWQALSWGGNKTSRATGRNNLQFTVYSLQCTVQSSPVLSLYINSSPLHVGLSLPRNTASLDLLLGEHTLRTEGGGKTGKWKKKLKIQNPHRTILTEPLVREMAVVTGLENPMVDSFVQLNTKHSSVELSW